MRKLLRQPWLTGTLAVTFELLLGAAVLVSRVPDWRQAALACVLAAAGAATFRYPVHVAAHIKLYLTAPALFISAIVLPPALAALVILIIGVAGNLLIRDRTGLLLADIANEGLRWAIAGTCASLVYRLLPQAWQPGPLMAAAIVMYAFDVITLSVIISTLDGRSLTNIIRDALDNWRFEGAMYLIGALGALDAAYQAWALLLLVIPSVLIYRAVQNSYELQGSTRKLIEGLADTVDVRDVYASGHSKRVAAYAEDMVNALKKQGMLGPIEGALIVTAARVHDIGKIEIPDSILQNVEPLTPEDMEIVASHVDRGAEILQCYPNFRRGVPLVRHHHERWDGSGYPHKLAAFDIPIGARIIAIADAFDGMTCESMGEAGVSKDRAAMVLRNGRGTQFDPEMVDLFLSTQDLSAHPHLRIVRSDLGERQAGETA